MRESRLPAPPVPGGFGFALGFVAGIAVTAVAVAAGAAGHPVWSLAALALAVAGVSALTTPLAALATALLAWCLQDGFVVGRHGDLVLAGGSVSSAAVLLFTGLAAVVLATAVRLRHSS
ncbi:MAG TPA: hypothetical protein VJT49_11385 [Amycolatopsis sp.]|uniref:hypothetical protein n=1 Tax=Amycolatopsis sp. TaxID=37632 RepID=UPI002B4A62C9|nr:hypothetical protein [Amycolatopsis sp.]HKS45693.1 hypothetical protein [Amycolatopsis sp.]